MGILVNLCCLRTSLLEEAIRSRSRGWAGGWREGRLGSPLCCGPTQTPPPWGPSVSPRSLKKKKKSTGSQKTQENSRKIPTSTSLTMLKPLTVWITINCGKFWEKWEYQTTWPASWEMCMEVKKHYSWTWKDRLIPNWERSMSRLHIVTLLI